MERTNPLSLIRRWLRGNYRLPIARIACLSGRAEADRHHVKFEDMTPGRIVATPRGELLKVRGVKYNRLAAQIVFPLQKNVTVREFGEDAVRLMHEPQPALLAKYETAIEKRRGKKK